MVAAIAPSKNDSDLRDLQFSAVESLWRAYAETLRPPEKLRPSEFSARHIVLQPNETEDPGPWRNDKFPYQPQIMDSVDDALRLGKTGWVMMKSAQGGGSRLVINVFAWLQSGDYAGAMAYMISKDELAEKFGIERIGPLVHTCAPLARKLLPGRERIRYKRFVDGSLSLFGGSILNLQSLPFRFFFFDEIDSMLDELKDGSDPIKMALQRMKSYFGPTLLLAFAHPSTKERGAALLFYTESDQRRGFVVCPHCSGEFWFQWAHVKPIHKEGMNQQQAELDPGCYEYHCPECSCEITDGQRMVMLQKVKYRSELPPEVAAKRQWVGVHFSQLYMPNQSLRALAAEWVGCQNEAQKRTFFNKVLGEPYETKVGEIKISTWRSLIIAPTPGKYLFRGKEFKHDPDAYYKGQVPPGVRFLTAGQDSRHAEFHFSVWGWGLRRILDMKPPGNLRLCGWLIDWGKFKRANPGPTFTENEYHVFDDLIFRRMYPTTYSDEHFQVLLGGFDVGYAPTQLAIHAYCRWWPGRAAPVKGAAETATSAIKSMPVKWGTPLKFKLDDTVVIDDSSKPLIVNTYLIKLELYGSLLRQFKTMTCHGPDLANQIVLPMDVDDGFIEEVTNEYLTKDDRGYELWKNKGPNHFADTSTYSMAAAVNLDPFQQALPFEEAVEIEEKHRKDQPNSAEDGGSQWQIGR